MHPARVLLSAVLALMITACSREGTLDARPPVVVDDPPDTLGPIPPSVLGSDVRYDLEPALQALEAAVPRRFGNIDTRIQLPGNKRVHIAFAAQRAPFRVSVQGTRVTISTSIEYEGRGWYKPFIGPEVSSACGTGGVPRPRALLTIVGDVALGSDWELRTRTSVRSVKAATDTERDRCRVTVLRIDVTERVLGAARGAVEGKLRDVDRSIARIKTRDRFDRWWASLARPIRLTDSVWFTINPEHVKLAGVSTQNGTLIASLILTARPRIESGRRPDSARTAIPLPPLERTTQRQDRMEVALRADIDYALATRLLSSSLVGKELGVADKILRVSEVELFGVGGGKVALGVAFEGSSRGKLYLIGTPIYDSDLDQLVVPDLDYDLNTADNLVRHLAWLQDARIRDFMRGKARFPVTGQLAHLRELAERGMNRQISEGVVLAGRLEQARAVNVSARQSGLVIRAVATGKARLEIDRPVSIKR